MRLSRAIGRSPWSTTISTDGWLSDAVENTCVFAVGMVVLRSISLVFTSPSVMIPSDSGVTSRSRTSLTSPLSTPAWMAAPIATTSSGLTPRCGSLSVKLLTSSWITGMRVEPPTRITSSSSLGGQPGVLEGRLERTAAARREVVGELLELAARERDREVLRARCIGGDERAG